MATIGSRSFLLWELHRNFKTESSEKHWNFVSRTADRVSQWPAWKQVQSRTVIGEPDPEERGGKNTWADTDQSAEESREIRTRQVA